jgi:hypothetical protein
MSEGRGGAYAPFQRSPSYSETKSTNFPAAVQGSDSQESVLWTYSIAHPAEILGRAQSSGERVLPVCDLVVDRHRRWGKHPRDSGSGFVILFPAQR